MPSIIKNSIKLFSALSINQVASIIRIGNAFVYDNINKYNSTDIDTISTDAVNWYVDAKKEDIYLESIDGYKQHALLFNNTNKCIVFVHDMDKDFLSLIEYAYRFYKLGYSTLLIDLRGHNLSEGKFTYGIKESADLAIFIDYIFNNYKYSINLFSEGISSGILLMTLNIINKDHIESVVIKDTCLSYKNYLEKYFKDLKLNNTSQLFSYIRTLILSKYNFDINELDYLSFLKNINVPICFVEKKIEEEKVLRLYHKKTNGIRKIYFYNECNLLNDEFYKTLNLYYNKSF